MPRYQSTKTYGTDRGLSTCFRQWRASHSHCSTLHGYSLGFKFVFESETLDSRNWAFDFGGMKPVKAYLDHMFDHTVLVAEDDPALEMFKTLAAFSTRPELNGVPTKKEVELYAEDRVCNLRIVPGVGCEMTAKMVWEKTSEILEDMKSGKDTRYEINSDVRLVSVECFEHGSNSAIYYGDTPERQTFYVDVGGMNSDEARDHLEHIKSSIRQRQTIDSSVIQALQDALPVKANVDGDLEIFRDQIDQLHHVEPVDPKRVPGELTAEEVELSRKMWGEENK
jgi:6-pyruvoyltetrahydropterin/6-carboxytetrahydropterin synthase